MDLIYVSDAPIPSDQANVVQMMSMCDAFQASGVKTTLLMPLIDSSKTDKWFRETYGVSDSFRMNFFKMNLPRLVRTPLFLLRSLIFVLFYTHGRHALVYTRCHLFGWLATTFGIPTIVELHVGFPLTHPIRQRALVSASRNPALKRIVVVTEAIKEDIALNLVKRGVNTLPEILVEQNGAPTPKPASPGFIWTGRKNSLQVGYVGHLYPGRGIEIVLKLGNDFPDVDFHIVGGRPEDIAHWKAQALSSNVNFHGHVPFAVVSEYLNRFDVAIAPYARAIFCEGGLIDTSQWFSPMKVFDYMSYGLAIVVSDLPRIREIVGDQDVVMLCNPDNYDEWRVAIQKLRDDSNLRTKLGEAARHLQTVSFSRAERAKKVVAGIEV